jgi:prolipoprotein diacylglyceryltransferase
MIIGTVIGARLGHCFFYQPDYYLSNPVEILKIWEGCLASHGATNGIIFALWLYSRNRPDQSWMWILDRTVMVVALGGFFIRMGNLMNSEIVGKPSDLPWSMVFLQPFESALREFGNNQIAQFSIQSDSEKPAGEAVPLRMNVTFRQDAINEEAAKEFANVIVPSLIARSNGDEELIRPAENPGVILEKNAEGAVVMQMKLLGISRHPAMVYESLSTLLLFFLLLLIWYRNPFLPEGRLFGLFVTILFSLRIGYEFLKENQVDFEDGLLLNMGQVLSIPMLLAGIFITIRSFRRVEIKK